MSKLVTIKNKLATFIVIAGLIGLSSFNQTVTAANNSGAFDIYITVDNCSGTVEMEEAQNCDQTQCEGIKSCMCLAKYDKIRWHIEGTGTTQGDSKPKFRLEFQGDSPLKSNCGRNFHSNQHNCVIKDDVLNGQVFDYDIYVENCPDPIDPRIVIRQ